MSKKFFLFFVGALMTLLLLLVGYRNRWLDREKFEPVFINSDPRTEESFLKPGDYKFSLNHEEKKRYYLLHIPESYEGKSIDLVLSFHGGMGTAEIQRDYYGWVKKSDEEGFAIAFPNGTSRLKSGKFATWNAGSCCGYSIESNSDDVGFVKKIIEDVKVKVSVDKIFATGMSNGGMLSHRLACEMPDTFTAVAAVAGTNNYDDCNPSKPISVMHIHGLQDDHVLFEGGCGPKCRIDGETEFVSVPETIEGWIGKNNCKKDPERILKNDKGYCELYSQCDDGTQVELCVAEDGGHSWPGAKLSPNKPESNRPSQAFSATDEVWNFFEAQN